MDVGFSGDLFVHVGNSLGPSFSILVVSSDHGGSVNEGSVESGGNGSDGSDGGDGDGVPLGGCVPGGSELGLGGLHLGGVSDVELGEGVSGHSQGSENNLKKILFFFFKNIQNYFF